MEHEDTKFINLNVNPNLNLSLYKFYLGFLEHGVGEFPGGGVAAGVGAELDVEVVDVFAGGEFGWGFYGVALDADVETAEVGDADLFAVQEVVAHHFTQFGEHEDNVGGLGGAVARDFLGELCKSYAAGLAGTGVVAVIGPLLFKGTYYCHNSCGLRPK